MNRCTYLRQNKKKMHRKYPTAIIRHYKKEDKVEALIAKVCDLYKVDPAVIKSTKDSRDRPYPEIRFLIMTLAKVKLKYSSRMAGEIFGKDKATAVHAVKTVRNLREIDKNYRKFTNPVFYS